MKIALVGNQNSGKTTLFNAITGMNAKIGNWPGVTVEKKSAIVKGTNYEITDLPGIYSLSPYSTEEEIARKFIFEENPEIIVNIIDSTSLERSLYLTTQLLELDSKVIVALNMADMLEKKGIKINIQKLEEKIGTKVVKISALKQTGITELLSEIKNYRTKNQIKIYDKDLENAINNINNNLSNNETHKRFTAVKILENDPRFCHYCTAFIEEQKHNLRKKYDIDIEEVVATERYRFIENVKKECTQRIVVETHNSDRLDKILLNKWIAIPIFIGIMFLIYYLSVGVVGKYTAEWISNGFENLGELMSAFMEKANVSSWINSLIVDGIIAGVGAVLSFIPQLAILFLCISILETTGYMARIAILLDKLFRKIGLSGKSLIPFIVGSGCSVPGIMGSRIIENEDERKMTAILTPFIPCSAKLPIIALFTGYFFKENAGLVSASLYFFAIGVIILSSFIMKKFIFKNTSSTYISELPEYKIPNLKYIVKDVAEKVLAFIKRAGSTILICSIIIWFLLSFSTKLEYGVNVEQSILAKVGQKISFVFYPVIGKNSWEATVSVIQGLVAKEQVISSMAVISGLAKETGTGNQIFEATGVFGFFTASSAYSFLVFNLFSAPCFGAIGAMKKELGGTKNVIKAVSFQIGLAWLLSTIVYQIGLNIERKNINLADLIISLCIAIVILGILNLKKNEGSCARCPYCASCSKK